MKKLTWITAFFILSVVVGILILNSCSKQEHMVLPTKESQIPDDALAVFNKITQFVDKVDYIQKNPNYKSGEQLTVDDALWNLNAGINLEISNPDEVYDEFYVDSVFVILPVSGDLISMDDIVLAWSDIESGSAVIINNAPFDDKAVKFTLIEIEEQNNSEITLQSTTIIGQKGTAPESPFSEEDDWWFGNDNGLCYTPEGEVDAGDLICDAINANRSQYVNDEGKIVFYTNPILIGEIDANDSETFQNPNDPIIEDNIKDYLIFYEHQDFCEPETNLWDDYFCIEVMTGNTYYNDMNFYYHGTTEVIYNKIPNAPNNIFGALGKTFIHIESLNGGDRYDESFDLYFSHRIENITYARRWVIED
jgi:hypothetical protein